MTRDAIRPIDREQILAFDLWLSDLNSPTMQGEDFAATWHEFMHVDRAMARAYFDRYQEEKGKRPHGITGE